MQQCEEEVQMQEPNAHEEQAKSNNQASPFLRLPPELRNKIYLLALTSEEYFIDWETEEVNLTYARLCCPHTPLFRNVIRNTNDVAHLAGLLYTYHMEACCPGSGIMSLREIPSGPGSLLLTCRRINEEATPIFYGRSAFHFASRTVLRKFRTSLGPSARKSIRTLRIAYAEARLESGPVVSAAWHTKDEKEWGRTCMDVARSFTGLEELTLRLEFDYRFYRFLPSPLPPACLDTWINPWATFAPEHGCCALKRVEIIGNIDGVSGGKMSLNSLKRVLLGEATYNDLKDSLPELGGRRCIHNRALINHRSGSPCVASECPLKDLTDGYILA